MTPYPSHFTGKKSHIRWLLVALVLALLQGCGERADRPNILIIMLDDFGYNDLAINNNSDSPTPELDDIARSGMRFTRHYTESSCSPTRAALLTGQYPARLGFHPNGAGIAHEVDTLPDVLAANGYTTHMVGKWHSGDAHRESRPEHQGFQQWFGFTNQLYLAGPDANGGYRRARPTYRNPWLETESGQLRQYKGHLTDILTQRAQQVISSARQPWFIYLAYFAPHTPIQPAARFAQRFDASKRGRYQALKAQVDTAIGALRQQLAEADQLENTIIAVLGDNGGTAKDYPSNLPFAGEKVGYQEGGVRPPLLLSWPARWAPEQTFNKTVSVIDLFPTLLAALKIDSPPQLDGVDFLAPYPQRRLYWYSHHSADLDRFSVLSEDGKWRLNSFFTPPLRLTSEANFTLADAPNDWSRAPATGKQLLVEYQHWLEDTTISRLHPDEQTAKIHAYIGDAFRRTPIASTHTLGIGFRVNDFRIDKGAAAEGAQQPLAYQQGYVSYSYNPGAEQLEIMVDGHATQLDVALQPNTCHSLVVTSNLQKNNMIIFSAESRSEQAIYVDGQLVSQRSYRNPVLSKASPRNALVVTTDTQADVYMPATSQPVISTRALNKGMINAKLHPELLAECESKQY